MIRTYYYKSPAGIIEFKTDNGKIFSLCFTRLLEHFDVTSEYNTICSQLDEYFAGKRKIFDLPLSIIGTDFQMKVWNEIKQIPYGLTLTYSDIAKNIGDKNLARAVGSACNKNPIIIIIPCHRVVSKNNDGGYAYGTKAKKYLLNLEKENINSRKG